MKGYLNISNEDNMALMARYPDNYFDLAVVDPPYGIGVGSDVRQGKKFTKSATRRNDYGNKNWDKNVPDLEYFTELFRVSKHQIIWGVNYYPFDLFAGGRIYWSKVTADSYSNSSGELAFCSKINSIRSYTFMWNGMLQGDMKNKEVRIHPTQKPVSLYQWIFKNYAKEGDKILDTHLGSGSIAIALDSVNKIEKMNLTLTASELDEEYYKAAIKRNNEQTAWQSLF